MAQPYVKDLLGSSEVVLIETRQHWMAAIRFALRPIVIALIGVGLLILNSIFEFNDDQFLSFINDLITWAVTILFLISIVWIPIDLIRWDSRRYVLTNRRAMLVEGVLQKNSIDSSLGQVTDIGMKETTFGRLLGYADLTLYTASEAANEVYEQLLDGKQFKIAVLDAKEAIRLGGSMDALPEGFVVKGGTNEASMRADGKLEDEQPAATAETQASEPPVAAAPPPPVAEPAAPAAQPEPVAPVEPAAEAPAPEPAPEPVSAPEPVAEPALVVEPEAAPAEPEPESESTPEPEAAAEEPAAAEASATAEEAATEATDEAWPAADAKPAEGPGADADEAKDEPKSKDDGPTAV